MTEITMITGEVILVKETPEEILAPADYNFGEMFRELNTKTRKIFVRLKHIVLMKEIKNDTRTSLN
jgi:hypothetical protein